LTRHRVDALGPAAHEPAERQTRHQTAFTVSIEAREGVTTGIFGADDRAKTIAVAINPESTRDDINHHPAISFPLLAREGGTTGARGPYRASVDIARKAGLAPAAVICEIMKRRRHDGPHCRTWFTFAQHHNLKLGTIADLIAHRRLTERLVRKVEDGTYAHPAGGDWRAVVLANTVEYQEAPWRWSKATSAAWNP